jgi:hypothetical protein
MRTNGEQEHPELMSHNRNSEDLVNRFSTQVEAVGGYFNSLEG